MPPQHISSRHPPSQTSTCLVLLHDPTTGTLTPLPSDGTDGPAWGVSGADMLTPELLHWLGYDDWDVRRDHPEACDASAGCSGAAAPPKLTQPLAAITDALDINQREA